MLNASNISSALLQTQHDTAKWDYGTTTPISLRRSDNLIVGKCDPLQNAPRLSSFQDLLHHSDTDLQNWRKFNGSNHNHRSSATPSSTLTQLVYPLGVYFLFAAKFFESFAVNGARTILALYMRDSLLYNEEDSVSILHIFNVVCQVAPMFGAMLADSYFGNHKVIFFFSIPYAIGYFGLTFDTIPEFQYMEQSLFLVWLMLVGLGNGNLRACTTSLGASQFKMPQQKLHLERYFSYFYFVYTVGMLLSKLIPPQVRGSTTCFGKLDCYTAVFGVIAMTFLISWIIFTLGIFYYKREPEPSGNVLMKVIKCICHGAANKMTGKSKRHDNWIDSAVGEYTETFVQDVSGFLKVIKLFLPLPIYWALLAQQDSSWTYQATELDTEVFGYYIEPDQVKALGPVLLLLQIPLWERLVQPQLRRHRMELTPLNSMTCGGLCAALSFVCAGLLQISIEQGYAPSVLWQIPQFFILMLGELLLGIPGLQFSYTQGPNTMKSVFTATWFLNNAAGNVMVVAITYLIDPFEHSTKFFIYALLMFIAILVFAYLAHDYAYNDEDPRRSSSRSMAESGHERYANGKTQRVQLHLHR